MVQCRKGLLILGICLSLSACVSAPTSTPTVAKAPAVETSKPVDLAAVTVPSLETYLGQGTPYLTALFGEPSLRRQEAGVELWQYAGHTCVVLFYLYGDKPSDLTIEHLEARHRDGGGEASDPIYCLKEAAAAKATRPVS